MKALLWLVRAVLGLLMGVLILASGMLLFSSAVKKEEPPVLLGYAPFTVSNGEMTPSLYPGDLAILRVGPESQPGDIVAFRIDGALTLRRVVGTSEEMYITQQEAFGQPDVNFLDPRQVEGVCVTYLPGCGALAEFLYSPIGLAVLVVLALAVLLIPSLLAGGSAKLEGPLVDYGQEPYDPPAPRRSAPAPRRRRELDDYEDEEEDAPLPAPPPRQPVRERPIVAALEGKEEEPLTAPRRQHPEKPARRGGSHYKPRH